LRLLKLRLSCLLQVLSPRGDSIMYPILCSIDASCWNWFGGLATIVYRTYYSFLVVPVVSPVSISLDIEGTVSDFLESFGYIE
jgi:hypothetical protein